jgi:GntR family transcriptional regulator
MPDKSGEGKAGSAPRLARQLRLDPASGVPLYRQIAQGIAGLVAEGTLRSDDRLPPIRALAAALNASHVTVSHAYDMLRRDGLVLAAPGRGTVIAAPPAQGGRPAAPAAPDAAAPLGAANRPLAPGEPSAALPSWPSFMRSPRTTLLQRGLLAGGGMARSPIYLSSGQPDADLLPVEALRRAWLAALRKAAPRDLLYAGPQGDPEVRATLAAYCAGLGYAARADEVLVTTGTQQAIDLVIRTFVRPGEHVLVESPGYPSALDLLESHGCRLVPVPVDGEGLCADLLPGLITRFRPRLLYLAPAGQNPTGTVLSPERRAQLRTLVCASDVLVLEDDVCSEFLYDGAQQPGLRSEETRERVITLKSFAKTVLPGLRVGCLLASPALLAPLAATKALTDRFTAPVAQHALRRYLSGRSVSDDLERARSAYRARRDLLIAELAQVMPSAVRWIVPRAGLNLWLTLPAGLAVEDVQRAAAEEGVACAPGTAFAVAPEAAEPALRLTFADTPPPLLQEGARHLARAVAAQLHHAADGRQRLGMVSV